MVETQGQSGAPEQDRARGPGRRVDPALVGRRVALAIYAVLAVWVMGSGLASVVPQIFWPEASGPEVAMHSSGCGAQIEALVTSLEEIALVRPESLRRERFAAWDESYLAIEASCESHPAYASLYHARYATQTAAERHDDELAPLLDEVRARARASGDRR
ncbi:MAG: hypothetical protein K1X94_14270 [Sandaracinaceae bacterium]|nr:hypothetical protein [Sandaracinaceae bacterium]